MVNTSVTLCGLPLENPVIPASGTFGYGYILFVQPNSPPLFVYFCFAAALMSSIHAVISVMFISSQNGTGVYVACASLKHSRRHHFAGLFNSPCRLKNSLPRW